MNFLVLTKSSGMLMGPISTVLGWIMELLFKLGVTNIGLCIILFTLIVKVIMFPLTIKQQKSSKLMAVMQPELQAIQNKYKGKTDNDSMMKQNVEMKAVYEKYGTSMTGGCLQLVIQMPILFALYRVIYNIPAYVTDLKVYFLNIVSAISGVGVENIASLPAGAADSLINFATTNNVSLSGMYAIGDLTGVSGETLANKMVDILYRLNPSQWQLLQEHFKGAATAITENYPAIESMNSFLGINLTAHPWSGSFVPTLAWLIPILAGLSQWYSTKLMMANQPQSEDAPGGQMMKQMNVMMPLMSVFFCFTFPAAVGIYWVASSVFQTVQQLIVNSYLNKVDIDEMVRKNVEKANKKREKKGLPPAKINQNASSSLKNIQAAAEQEEQKRLEKIEKNKKLMEESSQFYNKNAKPGSLAEKANMVAKYNEKNNK